MDLTLERPLLFALLLLVPLAARGRPALRRAVGSWRSLLAWSLLSFAASGPMLQRSVGTHRMLVVDASASVREPFDHLDPVLARVRGALGPGDSVSEVTFAAEAVLTNGFAAGEVPPTPHGTKPESGETDIESGLRLATELECASGRTIASRLLLLSDGRATRGDALAAARSARAQGLPVDVLPVCGRAPAEDGAILALSAPPEVRRGELFEVNAAVRAPASHAVQLELHAGDREVARRVVAAGSAAEVLHLVVPAVEEGMLRLRATLTPEGDPVPRNDRAETATFVRGPESVLWLADQPPPPRLQAPFAAAGLEVRGLSPEEAPADEAGLAGFAAVVVEDVSAERLGVERLAALRDRIELEGGGLLAFGATAAFGPGRWGETPLGPLLPVTMSPAGTGGGEPLALVLVLDVSGSMGVLEEGLEKLELARRAAVGILPWLGSGDQLAFVAFAGSPRLVRPLGPAPDREAWRTDLDSVGARGGTALLPALRLALGELAGARGVRRHLLLLSDGRSPPADAAAVDRLRLPAGVVLSAIGLGEDVDVAALSGLAERTGGRFVRVGRARDLATLLTHEAAAAAGHWLATGGLRVRVAATHPITAGLRPPSSIEGLARTSLRPEAVAPWVSENDGPLLALWARGLGRVACVATDLRSTLGGDLAASPDFPVLWGRLAAWLASGPASGERLVPRIERSGRGARLEVDALDRDGEFLEGLRLRAHLSPPRPGESSLEMRQTAPGRYEVDLPEPASGTRFLTVAPVPARGMLLARSAWSGDDGAELRDVGCDFTALKAIAAAGGGRLLEPDEDPLGPRGGSRRELPVLPALGLASTALLLMEWTRGSRVSRRPRGRDPKGESR